MNKAYFTFLQYATRKTGVGRTSWFFAIIIHIGALAAIWYGQSMIRDGEPWGWIVAGIGAIMAVGFWLGTRSNYRTDKAREEAGPSNPNNHHVELWDAAPYNCIHGVKPDKHTHECAWPIMHDGIPMPTLKERKIRVQI